MNAPTLLIGLGGTGSKIVERVSKMVTSEQQGRIACCVFDTDINELSGVEQRNPFIKTIQTSTKQTVGEYLDRDVQARDSWFPVNAILNGKTLTEGAGQVRAISRMALETVIRAGKMEPLHEAIQSLYKVEEDKDDQALRVVIVSSLAGGTGSGLILPVALYTRNYLKTHFRQSANITRGFFILPEVFYEVILGQPERNNLKANAYATLRELDAFLMKGDETLHEKFASSVTMQFPRAASTGYEEYDVRPYDFCFLFDAQNKDGGKLNSFDQYLDHAANCIYAQSIGPMNKRSNSSEDNTIRKLAKERGRNRYAGAGASMLIYPYEDIKSLIALKWAKNCVSKQWMVYDNNYKEQCKDNEEKREQGLAVAEQSLASFYVNQVEASANHDDPFAKAIIKSTGIYKNGVTREGDKWTVYVNNVLAKIKKDLTENTSDLKKRGQTADMLIRNLDNDWQSYITAYETALEYKLLSDVYVDEVSQTIAYAMYKSKRSTQDETGRDYQLETYLISDNKFMHPNAIRYMLIKILDLMKNNRAAIDRKKDTNKKYFETFEKSTFDITETEDVEETVNDLSQRKISLFNKWTKQPSGDQEEMQRKYIVFMENTEKYMVERVQSNVLARGIEYIENLIKAMDSFFMSFDSKVETLDDCIDGIYKKYSDSKGTTVRYVCASKNCFDKIYDKKPYRGSSISIDSELAKKIYNQVLDYSLMKDKPNNNRYFNELFDEGIIGYFKDCVTRDYGSELDVDIITAIEYEADYEGGFEDEDNAYALIDLYVRKVIGDTRKLSSPFIETPLGEAGDPLNSCTFNISLKPDKGDESPRAKLIRKELMNYGGAPDADIDKNTIMFYQSYYGLRATDLSKFAPPAKSITYNRTSGEYFKAYYELIDGIHPEPHKSKEISPHIDKWWHIITKMPDLDDDNQKKQEYEIYASFFWALLNKYVYLDESAGDVKVYKLRNILLKMDEDRLIVSNGTECDRLYEILDAIAIYPELIQKIMKQVNISIENDLNDSSSYEDGMLFAALKSLSISKPGIGKDAIASTNIFDIPMLMKKSSTQENYYETNVIELLKVEIEEIKRYLTNFCSGKELPEVMGKIIVEQFNKHLESVAMESVIHPAIYRESLFGKVGDTITSTLDELGLRNEAKKIREQVEDLRNSN